MSNSIRGGRGRGLLLAIGAAWALGAGGCVEEGDEEPAELTAIGPDDVEAEEDVEAPEPAPVELDRTAPADDPQALTPVGSFAAHVQSSGALAGGWCSGGGSLASTRLSTGRYQVSCSSLGPADANAQVVASEVGTPSRRCELAGGPSGTTSTTWTVRCFDAAGSLADSAFNLVRDHRAAGATSS